MKTSDSTPAEMYLDGARRRLLWYLTQVDQLSQPDRAFVDRVLAEFELALAMLDVNEAERKAAIRWSA